jgi:hypothetical protein
MAGLVGFVVNIRLNWLAPQVGAVEFPQVEGIAEGVCFVAAAT